MSVVPVLQAGSAVLLNAGFAWLVGSWLARRWLVAAGCSRIEIERSLRRGDIVGAALCASASVTALWAATAVMGGIELREVKGMFWLMLTTTDYGHAGCMSIAAVTLVFLARGWRSIAVSREWVVLAALAVFAVIRASMGHAGENGVWTVQLAAEAVHLIAIGGWTGLVAVSAWKAVPSPRLQLHSEGIRRYLDLMSRAAMAAVTVIGVTGVYNAWQRIGTPENLLHGLYAAAFLAKIALVGVALVLGGYNRYIGLRDASRSDAGIGRVSFVLRCESLILLGVLIAAAVMTLQQPPSAS